VTPPSLDQARARIRAEYLEMPGMKLTVDQVRRLCGVGSDICEVVLDALVAERFLSVRSDGRYLRRSDGMQMSLTPLKASLRGDAAVMVHRAS
jgi:hypothetical protein